MAFRLDFLMVVMSGYESAEMTVELLEIAQAVQ